jgi:hypothetical protein
VDGRVASSDVVHSDLTPIHYSVDCICWLFTHIFTGYFTIFKGLTTRRLYKSFGAKGLITYFYGVISNFCSLINFTCLHKHVLPTAVKISVQKAGF